MRVRHAVPTNLPATCYRGPIYSVHGLSRALAAGDINVRVFMTNIDGARVFGAHNGYG